MTLDQMARRAAGDLWTEAERDVEWAVMLADLRHARRRRQMGWVATVAAAVTVVLTVVGVSAGWPTQRDVAPARSPLPTTELLLVQPRQPSGLGTGGRLQAIGGQLPHLPRVGEDPDVPSQNWSFWSLAFSADGAKLAFGDSLSVGVVDLRTGKTTTLRACRYCAVAWTPSGDVLSATADRSTVFISHPDDGRTSVLALPPQWRATSIDVSPAGRVLLGGLVGGTSAAMTTSLDGRAPTVLARYPGARVYEPRWSPDGDSVALLHKKGAWNEMVEAPLQLRVMTADGTGEHVVATLGTCYCHRASPHLDWSDSGRLAVLAVSGGTHTSLHEVTLDGTVGPSLGSPLGAIAWRAATTASPSPPTRATTTPGPPMDRAEQFYTREMVGESPAATETGVITFAFSPDGSRLVLSTLSSIVIGTPDTGRREELATCPDAPCPVAWTPAGDRVVTASPGLLRVIDVHSRSVRAVPLPRDWRPLSIDVSRSGQVLLIASGPLGQSRLATLPLAGGTPTVVVRPPAATFVMDARWSPDARTIAWMSKAEPALAQGGGASVTDLVVHTARADGSSRRRLAVVGRCACLGHTAGLDWSPQGRLAVMSSDGKTQMALEVDPATGRLTPLAASGSGPVAWRPAG